MIDEHMVSRLNGTLFAISHIMKDGPSDLCLSARVFQLDRANILHSFLQKNSTERCHIGSVSNLKTLKFSIVYIEEMFSRIIRGKVNNGEYLCWHIMESIRILTSDFSLASFHECDFVDEHTKGKLLFLPIDEKFLVLFLSE